MIEEDIYSTLSNHAGLTALVSEIFHGESEAGVDLPFISFSCFTDDPLSTLDGANGTINSQWNVDIYANTVTEARNIAVQVRDAFDSAILFKAVLGARRGPKRIEPGYQHCQVEFSVWHN